MKQETKVFVTADADFCLLLRGDSKKLMSFEEVVEALMPKVCYRTEIGITIEDTNKNLWGFLVTKNTYAINLAEVCQKFNYLLWPETQTA